MTATLTKTAANYTNGSCTYHLSLRTSSPTSGTLQNLRAAWFFITDGAGTILYYHHGLEWIHTALTDGQGAYALIVCNDGTEEWATSTTLAVGSTFAWHKYVNYSTGDDGNTGGSSDPFQTIEAAIDDLRASGLSNAASDFMLELSNETHPYGTIASGDFIWNQNTQANGLGSAFLGRLTFRGAGSSTKITAGGTDASCINNTVSNCGIASINVHWEGVYTTGGAAHTGYCFNNGRSSGNGWNFTFCGGSIKGFNSAIVNQAPLPTADYDNIVDGYFDWLSVQDCSLDDHYAYHIFAGGTRYLGLHRITFNDLTGTGTGSSLRIGTAQDYSIGECTWDRSGTSWKSNCYRDNGGTGQIDCESRRQSIYKLVFRGCEEGMEFDQVGAPVDYDGAVISDVWIMGCIFDLTDSGNDRFPIEITSDTSGYTYDVTNFRVTACGGRTTRGGMSLVHINNHSSATTNKVHSFRMDQCAMYQVGAYGFYGYSAVMGSFGGVNYDDDCFTLLGNYGYCAETATDFSHPVAMWDFGSLTPADKILESDYNVLAKFANSSDTKWFVDGTDLTSWDDGGQDTHSYQLYNETSANMTNVSTGTYDPTPASGTGPQMARGYPGAVYAGGDRKLYSTTVPDAGPFMRGGTTMDDPDLSGESPSGVSGSGVGVFTVPSATAIGSPVLVGAGAGVLTPPTAAAAGSPVLVGVGSGAFTLPTAAGVGDAGEPGTDGPTIAAARTFGIGIGIGIRI